MIWKNGTEYSKKLARLNKIAVSPTTREKAILYVDGEIYEGENHTQIINKLCDEKRVIWMQV